MNNRIILGAIAMGLTAGLGACRSYDTVDDACHKKVPGEKRNDPDAAAFLNRINCYRRMAKLPRARIDWKVSAAAEAHAAYRDLHPEEPFGSEIPGSEGFTGESFEDRLVYQGWDVERIPFSYRYYSFGSYSSQDAAEYVDLLMPDRLMRDAFLQTAVYTTGIGVTDTQLEIYVIYDLTGTDQYPVIFPSDGQTDVPITGGQINWSNTDYVPIDPPYGPGINIVSSSANMELEDVIFTQGADDVPYQAFGPSFSQGLYQSIVVFPVDPLIPNADYSFEANVLVDGAARRVKSRFRTNSESSPL